ncbi:MAG TPA: transketolase C-terminal domain-containing protein [Candidatus Hydrogenedentes bacterium]|nr:transketolase C-terminal domain-containing protein [Candidatus Hydrogenedentota bacterium]HPG65594.1 transketolase C-terminal domain-containing protein [Candidatus Hydrogenedentota bacterium]
MRQACLKMVYELAKRDERVVFVGSDLGAGTLDEFRRELPDRFFMEGVSEAAVIGLSAGLAKEGYIVYVNTLAVFLTRRALEQVALDVCLHNLNVRLIGNGGGLVYAPLGPTHMATDDIALLRPLEHMTIVAPADKTEMERLMPLTLDHAGPMYIRVAKGYDPIVTPADEDFAIGKAIIVRRGGPVLLVTTGITLGIALEAAETLARDGLQAAVLHMPTVKPLDLDTFAALAAEARAVITIEEHVLTGGLGSAVAEALAETMSARPKAFRRIALPDEFPDRYGSQAELLEYYGVTPARVVAVAKELRRS